MSALSYLRQKTASAKVRKQTDPNRVKVHAWRNLKEDAVIAHQEFYGDTTRGRIDTSDVDHLLYWMDLMHADAEMLKEAIDAVGPAEEKVREHLSKKRMH